jgi:repressor of RNA polymerase III transcription MAF1
MKFLDCPKLLQFMQQYLNKYDMGDRILTGVLEAYSCKMAKQDKRLVKDLETKLAIDIRASPDRAASAIGSLSNASIRRLLFNMITALNLAFPDYDFSSSNADQFTPVTLHDVTHAINVQLLDELKASVTVGGNYSSPDGTHGLHGLLHSTHTTNDHQQHTATTLSTEQVQHTTVIREVWSDIDQVITLKDCNVYMFTPATLSVTNAADGDSGLFSNKLWHFTYFFVNNQENRMLLFSASAKSKMSMIRLAQRGDNDGDDDDDDRESESLTLSQDVDSTWETRTAQPPRFPVCTDSPQVAAMVNASAMALWDSAAAATVSSSSTDADADADADGSGSTSAASKVDDFKL